MPLIITSDGEVSSAPLLFCCCPPELALVCLYCELACLLSVITRMKQHELMHPPGAGVHLWCCCGLLVHGADAGMPGAGLQGAESSQGGLYWHLLFTPLVALSSERLFFFFSLSFHEMQINRCCIHILTRCQGEKGSLSFRERCKHRQGEAGEWRGDRKKGGLEGGRGGPMGWDVAVPCAGRCQRGEQQLGTRQQD